MGKKKSGKKKAGGGKKSHSQSAHAQTSQGGQGGQGGQEETVNRVELSEEEKVHARCKLWVRAMELVLEALQDAAYRDVVSLAGDGITLGRDERDRVVAALAVRALGFSLMQSYDESIDDCQTLLRIEPSFTPAVVLAAGNHFKLRRFTEAHALLVEHTDTYTGSDTEDDKGATRHELCRAQACVPFREALKSVVQAQGGTSTGGPTSVGRDTAVPSKAVQKRVNAASDTMKAALGKQENMIRKFLQRVVDACNGKDIAKGSDNKTKETTPLQQALRRYLVDIGVAIHVIDALEDDPTTCQLLEELTDPVHSPDFCKLSAVSASRLLHIVRCQEAYQRRAIESAAASGKGKKGRKKGGGGGGGSSTSDKGLVRPRATAQTHYCPNYLPCPAVVKAAPMLQGKNQFLMSGRFTYTPFKLSEGEDSDATFMRSRRAVNADRRITYSYRPPEGEAQEHLLLDMNLATMKILELGSQVGPDGKVHHVLHSRARAFLRFMMTMYNSVLYAPQAAVMLQSFKAKPSDLPGFEAVGHFLAGFLDSWTDTVMDFELQYNKGFHDSREVCRINAARFYFRYIECWAFWDLPHVLYRPLDDLDPHAKLIRWRQQYAYLSSPRGLVEALHISRHMPVHILKDKCDSIAPAKTVSCTGPADNGGVGTSAGSADRGKGDATTATGQAVPPSIVWPDPNEMATSKHTGHLNLTLSHPLAVTYAALHYYVAQFFPLYMLDQFEDQYDDPTRILGDPSAEPWDGTTPAWTPHELQVMGDLSTALVLYRGEMYKTMMVDWVRLMNNIEAWIPRNSPHQAQLRHLAYIVAGAGFYRLNRVGAFNSAFKCFEEAVEILHQYREAFQDKHTGWVTYNYHRLRFLNHM